MAAVTAAAVEVAAAAVAAAHKLDSQTAGAGNRGYVRLLAAFGNGRVSPRRICTRTLVRGQDFNMTDYCPPCPLEDKVMDS